MVRRGSARSVSAAARLAGMALIELLVAIIIIALLAGAFYGFWRHHNSGKEKTLPAQAIDKAKGVECQNMLQQVRARIEMAKADNDDRPPASIPSDMADYAKCPETGQPYSYDPQTGRVWCTTPGHEKF